MHGYAGRLLTVELASGRVGSLEVPEAAQKSLIGGSGLGAWLFLHRSRLDAEPLSPENTLWILNGPLAGTGFPGSSRFTVCARSPLTGLWGEAVVIPPVAMNVFVVKNITKVPFGVIYRGVVPFLGGLVLCAALLFIFPQLATLLPSLLMK